jgi:putative DNA primase/helicase
MYQPQDVLAFLIDKGDPSFVAEDYGERYGEPWASLIAELMETEPLERAARFESLMDDAGGTGDEEQADEVRSLVYEAMQQRFARKRNAEGLQDVPPALEDEKEQMDRSALYKAVQTEEDGDASVFAGLYQGQVAFDHSEGQWYLWEGQHWVEDTTNAIINLLRTEVAGQFAQQGAQLIKEDKADAAKNYMKRAERLHTRRRKEHVLWAAASLPELALSGDEWDAHPWLLGTPNGVIDLQSGTFRPGQPRDWIRTVVPTTWQSLNAPAPRWERFLREIFDHDEEIVRFVHRLLGYGVTGLNSEHAFPVLWGPQGRNGKTTLLETLAAVLGPDITMSIPADDLMHTYRGGSGPQPYIVKLRGKRVVWSSETNPDRRLDGETVKKLTGGDRIHAHAKYKNPVEFTPTHLLLLLTNHRPKIEAADLAIWDRVHLIPFTLRFVDHPQKPNERQRDAHLLAKLKEEREGILAWLVRGCLEWQRAGSLQPPEQVQLATDEYRAEEDTVGQFIDEHCVQTYDAQVTHRKFYKAYTQWCKDLRLYPAGSREFGATLKARFEHKHTRQGMTYFGIGLPFEGSGQQIAFD